MTKLGSGICVLMLAICWGCGPKSESSAEHAADRQIDSKWEPAQTTHTRVQVEPLGEIPNCRLQLPAVSPDGKWIAYLDYQSDEPIGLSALFSGRGLEAMSLHVQPVAGGTPGRMVCGSGAAWPRWSGNSRRLVFVAYSESGECELGLYDVAGGTSRRVRTGLKHMMMPSVSPSGKEAVVVAAGNEGESLGLHIVNLDSGKIERSCPTEPQGSRQLWPQWTSDGRIVFVVNQGERSWLGQWGPGRFPPERLSEIRMSTSQVGMLRALSDVSEPLSPDDKHFAYYDTTAHRIVLVKLAGGAQVNLGRGVRTGCWLDSRRFAGADNKEMLLFAVEGGMPARLLDGACLPLNGNAKNDELIVCRRGRHSRMFSLVRIRVLSSE